MHAGSPATSLLKNVDQMDKVKDPYRNGIPKDLPNGTKDSHWVKEVDEREAEEDLSLYCKPVELYNIIQQRCEHQPLFMQRCLSYKIQAALQRRIKMTVSVIGYLMGKMRGKDPVPINGPFVRTVFVMVTRPVTYPAEGQIMYRYKEAQVLKIEGSHSSSSGDCSEGGVTFILPEMRRLVQNAKIGDVVLFVIRDSTDVENAQVASLANCSGRVVWGKLAILSLCLTWLRNSKENAPQAMLDGTIMETTSQVDLRHGNLQHEDSTEGKNIKLSPVTKATTERSLVQLRVRVSGAEVGQAMPNDKKSNGTLPGSPLPYSLSHALRRPRVGSVFFHYLYYHGILRKTEVTEDFTCPFCLNGSASFKGLRCHLNASHDLFNFEYVVTGELQVVNVSCRPDVVGPQGNIRDVDGLSDPRVKNFSYWFKGSRHFRRRVALTSGEHEHLLEKDAQNPLVSSVEEIPQLASEHEPVRGSGLHQAGDLCEEDMDARGGAVEVAGASEQPLADTSVGRKFEKVPNGVNVPIPNGIIDGNRKKDFKNGDKSLQQEPKSRTGKAQDIDSLGNLLKHRSSPAQKRQRMKGVLGERALARSRPSPTFGGACASAGGGQDLDDCGGQQGLSVPNKIATDRPDIPRTHALLQKRQYFHSHTAQPMDADQLFGDRDSEDEVDTVIADLEDRRMLDDFVDVTPEEKEVMHLWNSFVRRNRVVADGHCPWACGEFSRENALRFGQNPALRRCLMLFLVKLWNHHLVDGATINRCLAIVDSHEPKEQEQPRK